MEIAAKLTATALVCCVPLFWVAWNNDRAWWAPIIGIGSATIALGSILALAIMGIWSL